MPGRAEASRGARTGIGLGAPDIVPWARYTCRAGASTAATDPADRPFSTRRLRRHLAAAGIFCDAAHPCNVTRGAGDVVRICLPEPALDARICEPWGHWWQQLGAFVRDGVESDSCVAFNLTLVRRWHSSLRDCARPPFFRRDQTVPPYSAKRNELNRRFQVLVRENLRNSAQRFAAYHKPIHFSAAIQSVRKLFAFLVSPAYVAAYDNVTGGGSRAAPCTPRYATCAVAGSGPSLMCGQARGNEIDGHDAVFRANAFQLGMGAGMESRLESGGAAGRPRSLRDHWVGAERAGVRTTHRVNCLYDNSSVAASRGEVCIVSRAWFAMGWGEESFNNEPHPCCTSRYVGHRSPSPLCSLHYTAPSSFAYRRQRARRSDYRIETLQALSERQRVLLFLGAHEGTSLPSWHSEPALTAQLSGSGGNALQVSSPSPTHPSRP